MVDPFPIQGMMLSERPGASSIQHGQPSIGVGSFKGVMLCNRPFAGAAVGAQGQTDTDNKAGVFSCGTVAKEIGSNVPISSKEKVLSNNKNKKDSALSRHKRWLADLQKTKERLESEYLDEEARKKDSRRKFMENQAKMRAMVRGQLEQAKDAKDHAEEGKYDSDPGDYDEGDVDHDGAEAGAKKTKSKKANRPAWALTEEESKKVEEDKENEEVDELLSFTKGLDFDKYIHDMEIQTMIDQVMKRINELENMEEDDIPEDEDVRQELEKQRRELSRLTGENLRRYEEELGGWNNGKRPENEPDDDVRSITKSILSEGGRSVRSVHSHKSVNQLAVRARDKMKKEMLGAIQESEGSGLRVQPKIISHEEDRFENKNVISNLPYMHRNPAV